MQFETLNTIGLKCPKPILKLAVRAVYMNSGDILELWGDCPTLERDLRIWCERLQKTFLAKEDNGNGAKKFQIQF
jgi:tRNA 2-thiouridine synthesizing protein A